jgi:hypothetical protein
MLGVTNQPMKTNVKESFRKMITALPWGKDILMIRHYLREYFRLAKIGSAKEIFHHHYAFNEWGSSESISGLGSTIQYTENIRK